MPRSSTLYHPVQEPLLLAHGRCCLSVWLAVASVWAGSLPQLHLCDHCRSLCWMGGTTLCLACKVDGVGGLTSGSVLFYHTAPGLDTHREEGALGAGSCWHLPRWAEMELRKLGGSPSTKQQNLALLRGPVGCLPAVHAGESLGSALPARRWNVPSSKSSQPVGLGRARGSLSSTCPSGTPPTAQKSCKVLALLLSRGACPPQAAGVSVSQVFHLRPVSSYADQQNPTSCGLVFPSSSPVLGVRRSWTPAHPAPFLVAPSVGWGGGGARGPLDRGVATLPFSVRSSPLDMGGLFCNLQVVFWFSYICCIFMFHMFWGDFCLAFILHHLF